ncbi:hypothetical protein R69927_06190 [Paraburkholderia domus]|jgi:Protein of unknown function (DUF3313).|uniref:DUF3313 domain-containing protein n=1 Tax=Paraburkholderia domus TaxID=2793075 RepID=A0A9N8N491_9BURK|nr:DUF3313 domain-containing protein [Paraburkholderia domus]MBK5064415.1 DUF3313 domain-containing protein [Burkholderia sp. R-70199]MBK5090220.1 DUF3313 domain-containing protein [Burkholderia sp. R-69927]MBK5122428.1 DUF3313 domain-containing protein [Burkholderia sp. R-69980]MBK5168388.1 DUF3313 domain-containing protein [Burkholderia sp. R-70211]MBK5183796.1 DUF3313 domain-containing protein [Burkholderia sp. R-69749]MCI0149304.1 DUF3313 family protein [Paraburkholderia sediminicola]
MYKSMKPRHLLIAVICTALIGCSSVKPVAYSGIASSSSLQPNQQDESGRVPYRFSTQADWRKYGRLIVDPVVVYRGADNQFGSMQDKDKATLASYMQTTFAEKLRNRFELTNDSGPGTLRLKLTLTGAETTTPVLGTFSRFDIAGGIYNVVQTARGKEGAFTGSVTYAVEIYDASTNRLLSAYVTKQYPNPYNIGASFGSLSASKTGIDKGADALMAQLK